MNIFAIIWNEVGKIYETFFSSDLEVMSPKAQRILSNPKDRKIYLDAIDKLNIQEKVEGEEKKETIKLSNDEEITLVV